MWIAFAVVNVVVVIGIIVTVVLLRAQRSKPNLCGGCRRALAPEWEQCLFCGWIVPAPIPRLEFLCGPLVGQAIPLDGEITTIGSVAGNTIVLADPGISRKHLGIRRHGKEYEFADLGSTNGVYLNGVRLPKNPLVHGDILRVGSTEMMFKFE